EATDDLAASHRRQEARALLFAAVGVDRVHGQGSLHADEAPEGAVAVLELLEHQPVLDGAHARALVAGDRRPEHAEPGELRDELPGEALRLEQLCGLGQILAAHEATDRGTDQTLLLREVLVQRRELLEAERRSRHASPRVLSPRGGSHRGASTADVQPGLRTCTVRCRGAPLRRVASAGWGLPTSPGRRG